MILINKLFYLLNVYFLRKSLQEAMCSDMNSDGRITTHLERLSFNEDNLEIKQ